MHDSWIPLLNQTGISIWRIAGLATLQAGILIAIVLAADLCLRHRVRAALRYGLWMLVVLKLLLPPAFISPTGIAYWVAPSFTPPPVEATAAQWKVSFSEPATLPQILPAVPFVPPRPRLTAPAVGLGLWILGAIILASGMARRQRRISRLLQNAKPAPRNLQNLLAVTARQLGIQTAPALRCIAEPLSPALCGFFRPVILLPAQLELSDAAWRTVFLHELTHLRRHDLWANSLQALVQVVWWWNPLVWWINARIRQIRETAVDEAVMLATDRDASDYPATLVTLARHCLAQPTWTLGFLGILTNSSRLERRIRRLLERPLPDSAHLGWRGWCVVICVGALAMPMGYRTRAEISEPHVPTRHLTIPPATEAIPASRTNPSIQLAESPSLKLARKLVHPGLQTLVSQFDQMELRRQSLSPDFGPEHPEVKRVNQVLKTISSQIDREVKLLRSKSKPVAQSEEVPRTIVNVRAGADVSPITATSSQESPKPADPVLYTRLFRVDSQMMLRVLGQDTDASIPAGGNVVQLQLLQFLTRNGVPFPKPEAGRDFGPNQPAVFFKDKTGHLFARATLETLDRLEKVIQNLSPAVSQIQIESKFIEGNLGDLIALNLPGLSTNPAASQHTVLTEIEAAALLARISAGAGFEVLSQPKVTTLSGRAAEISVVDLRTVVVGKSNTAAGQEVFFTNAIPCGPTLNVTAWHDTAQPGAIRMTATARLVEFLGYQQAPTPTPIIRSNSVSADALLWDGQTHLVRMTPVTNLVRFSSKVPVLGDIPVLGRLFRTSGSSSVVRQRLVLITPTLIDPAGNRLYDPQHRPFDPATPPK